MIKLIINEKPLAQARPRVTRYGTFDPHYDKNNWIKFLISQQYKQEPINYPISVQMCFYLPIPKSTSKKKTALMLDNDIKHTKKPDLDNLAKKYLDCMNSIVFKDDSLIYMLTVSKRYSQQPRTEITITA